MAVSIMVLIVFALMVWLMASNRLPTVLGLPVFAILLALIGRIPFAEVQTKIVKDGIMLLSGAYIPIIIAGILSEVVRQTGIAENIVRRAAELGGDNPVLVAILCFIASAFAFTGLYGTGSLIMIGMIVLPIMISVNVPKVVAGGLLLMGCFIGYAFNVARWQFMVELLGVDIKLVQHFAFIFFFVGIACALIFMFVGIKVRGPVFGWSLKLESGMATGAAYEKVPAYALLTPIIPLVLVAAFKWDVIISFLVAIVYAVLTTQGKKKFKGVGNLLTRTIFDGFSSTALTVSLMFGIGMLVKAATHPNLAAPIGDLLKGVYPHSILGYILLFGIFGPPLTQYRGPMNPWGLGAAIAKIMAAGPLSLPALLGAFWTFDFVVGVSDATSSQTVWTAGYVGKTPVDIQKATLPFTWGAALVGVVISAVIFPLFK